MQVKNISARGWWINGKMVAPGKTETVDATVADIGDNPDLVIVAEEVESPAPEVAADPVAEPEQEAEKRRPGRPAGVKAE